MAKRFRDLIAAMPPERQETIRRGAEKLIAEMRARALAGAPDAGNHPEPAGDPAPTE